MALLKSDQIFTNRFGAFPPALSPVAVGIDVRGHWAGTLHTFRKALANGAHKATVNSLMWDLSKGCTCPYYKQIKSVPSQTTSRSARRVRDCSSRYGYTLYLDMYLPCRKCHICMRKRRNLWVARMRAEAQTASRVWFGTLTLSPAEHYKALCESASRRNLPISELGSSDLEWRARVAGVSRLATLYFKRLRKHGAVFRYILVFERHKSGLPHCHLLVFEYANPVRKRLLQEQWSHGFSSFKLVDADEMNKAAYYAAKYLMKDATTRVRASLNFGASDINTSSDIVGSNNVSNVLTSPYPRLYKGGELDCSSKVNDDCISSTSRPVLAVSREQAGPVETGQTFEAGKTVRPGERQFQADTIPYPGERQLPSETAHPPSAPQFPSWFQTWLRD